MSNFYIFPFSSARKPIPWSNKKMLHCCWCQWNCFQQFNVSNLGIFFFINLLFFLKVFFFEIFFEFFQRQGPGNLLYSLAKGHCLVSNNNGMVFNILMSRFLAFFGIFLLSLTKIFCQFLVFVYSQVPEILFSGLIKSYWIVVSVNEIVFKNLAMRIFEIFW